MTDNRIQVTLTARDLLSPQLGQIKNTIESLGAKANIRLGLNDIRNLGQTDLTRLRSQIDSFRDVGANLSQLGGSQGFFGAALFGQLGASAIVQGIQMVGSGIQAAIGSIQTAARTQINDLALAGDLASQLGVNFTKAKGLVAETADEISKMAEQLPGENKDYNAIFNQISATVAGNAKGDISKFKEESMELTKRFGILSSIRGLDANQSGSAINRALAGTMGLREVFQIDIFQKFPLLQKNITDQLKAMGKGTEDWMKLTNETREKILLNGAKGAVTNDTVDSFSGTVDSMIAEAKAGLFDERRGMFGFLKKLPGMQDRSAMDAVQGSMMSFKSLLESLGSLNNRYGLNFDPMEGVIRTFDWFSDFAGTVNGVLNGEDPKSIFKVFDSSFDFGNAMMKNLAKSVDKIDWILIGKGLATTFEWGLTKVFTFDWVSLASTFTSLISGSIMSLGTAIAQIISDIPKTITSGEISRKIYESNQSQNDPKAEYNQNLPQVGKQNDLFGSMGDVLRIPQASEWLNKSIPGLNDPNASWNVGTPLSIPKTSDVNRQAFAPTVNVNGAQMQNPQDIASAVMNAINAEYGKFKQNSLA
ncbi:hypothetical protein [Nostoc sp.]|uniref:hypothetical protein n=1 Tax=Nostoc sp. TaxID=1180 RepID=UPI002FF465CA